MAAFTKRIGNRIRQLRRKAGLSQANLAQAARLSVETVSRYERGVLIPSIESLEAMAEAMRLPLVTFFDEGNKVSDLSPDLLKIINRLKTEDSATIRRAYRVLEAMLS